MREEGWIFWGVLLERAAGGWKGRRKGGWLVGNGYVAEVVGFYALRLDGKKLRRSNFRADL